MRITVIPSDEARAVVILENDDIDLTEYPLDKYPSEEDE